MDLTGFLYNIFFICGRDNCDVHFVMTVLGDTVMHTVAWFIREYTIRSMEVVFTGIL